MAREPEQGGVLMRQSYLANAGAAGNNSELRVGLLGFGTVGSAFAEVLRTCGPERVRLTHVYSVGIERKRSHARAQFVAAKGVWTETVENLVEAADVDVVVELIGGLDPA